MLSQDSSGFFSPNTVRCWLCLRFTLEEPGPTLHFLGRAAKNNVPVCKVGSVTDLAFPLSPHNLAALIICLYPYSESQGQPGQQVRISHTRFDKQPQLAKQFTSTTVALSALPRGCRGVHVPRPCCSTQPYAQYLPGFPLVQPGSSSPSTSRKFQVPGISAQKSRGGLR